jgi:hypothetical protein
MPIEAQSEPTEFRDDCLQTWGAIRSGERAAAEILANLKAEKPTR